MNQPKDIKEGLIESNPWWNGNFTLEYKPREIYVQLKTFLDARQILALTGLRRVGKTTLLLKILEEYQKKANAKNLVYFSFDDFRNIKVKDVVLAYTQLMGKDINSGRYLFLFDEIQKIKEWEEQVKRIYDQHPHIKIIVSGSESLFIRKQVRESLAGRFFEFKVNPLTFREFLEFKNIHVENVLLHREDLLRAFTQYTLCSGFPELIDREADFIQKYIQENIIERILYKDIPQIFPIRDTAVLGQIFKIICLNPGQILNIESLANELGVSRQTVSAYLLYLEQSFLLVKLYNYSGNARKTERKLKKYYPTILVPELLEKRDMGKIFETEMVLQLGAEFFWRDTYKNEVDIIKVKDGNPQPIEIKFSRIETKPLQIFMRKYRLRNGIIISYDMEEVIPLALGSVKVIPFYQFLLENNK